MTSQKKGGSCLLACIVLAGLWLVLVVTTLMHTYGDVTTANAGVWWNVPGTAHWCGFEYRGHPGFFCDVT